MAENVISIGFSNKEFLELKVKAEEKGISIQQYIKFKSLSDSEFFKRFEELKLRVQAIPGGATFTIKMVFGTDWLSISKGVRLSLGRNFYNQVIARVIPEVTVSEKDSTHTQQYIKN